MDHIENHGLPWLFAWFCIAFNLPKGLVFMADRDEAGGIGATQAPALGPRGGQGLRGRLRAQLLRALGLQAAGRSQRHRLRCGLGQRALAAHERPRGTTCRGAAGEEAGGPSEVLGEGALRGLGLRPRHLEARWPFRGVS